MAAIPRTSVAPQTDLLAVPDEVLQTLILKHIDVRSLGRLAQVNRALRIAVFSHGQHHLHWRDLRFREAVHRAVRKVR